MSVPTHASVHGSEKPIPNIEASSIITSFPTEILEHIFCICGSLPLSWAESPNRLAVSQVCRQWRLIALSTPAMWTRIDVGKLELAKVLLVRSGSSPLDIVCSPDSPTGTPMIELCGDDLRPHAGRIRSFDISFKSAYELHNLLHPLGDEIQNISSLSLCYLLWRPPTSEPITCPGDMPLKLEKFQFWGVSAHWLPQIGNPRLTTLILRGIGSRFAPLIPDIRNILSSSPRLEHFSIDKINITRAKYSSHLPPIDVPCLRELAIDEQESAIYYLLRCMSLSHEVHVTLDFRYIFRLQPILPPSQTSAAYSYDQEVTRIVVHGNAVKLLRPNVILSTPPTVIHSEASENPAAYLAGLASHLDLARFTTFELNKGIILFLTPQILGRFISRFASLTTLRVVPNSEEDPSAYAHPSSAFPRCHVGEGSRTEEALNETSLEAVDVDGSKSLLTIVRAYHQAVQPLMLLDLKLPMPEDIIFHLKEFVANITMIQALEAHQ